MDSNLQTIRQANPEDVDSLVRIINAAFGVEKFFIERDRIDSETVRKMLNKGRFLLVEDDTGLAACIYLELRGKRGYFGLLSVDPSRQKSGFGRKMVNAGEDFFRANGCRYSDMRIVNLRAELPAFYDRLGYKVTGTEQFDGPVETLIPCHFILYSKPLF